MATASDTGLFEVMEVDEEAAELMIFAEDQQDQSDISLDIDLRNNEPNIVNDNNIKIPSNNNKKPHNKRLKGSRIEVVVRKRPMNSREIDNCETDIGSVNPMDSKITICEPRLKVDLTKFTQYHHFKFDHCFDENATNKQIYEICVKPLFNTILRVSNNNKFAGKATCFGYGQTGSGKTYTLLGSMDPKTGQYVQGLYAMAVRDLFKYLPINNQIIVSFYEIYGGKLFDLLADRKQILCREDGKQKVNIIGLKRTKCESAEIVMDVISAGNAIRQTGSTGANNTSSRSHAILSIDILPIRGRLSFIDLAGSERGADTQNNDKQTRIEGAEINKSLLALKECIRALDQNSIHKPFRGSKLTQVLKESFMGNSRTLMIANISPNSGSCENTLNTLRYAYRVKELKNENNDTNDNKKSMLRNRSEPNLPIYNKSMSRPTTARKRNKNNNSNSNSNSNSRSKKNNNNNNNNNNNRYLSSQNKNTRSRSSNNSDCNTKNNNRQHRIKRRKLQQNVNTESKQQKSPKENHRKKTKSPPHNFNAGDVKKHHDKKENSKNMSPKQKNMSPKHNDNDNDNDNNDVFNNDLSKKQLIKAHRKHIDEFMILIKEDMQLLKSFDKDEYNNNDYQQKLKDVLDRQQNAVTKYKSKVFNN